VGITEALVRGGGSEQMGPRMGENTKLGIGGRESTGLDTHFGTEEEQGTQTNGPSTYAHSRSIV
jgi:hypothetical protein